MIGFPPRSQKTPNGVILERGARRRVRHLGLAFLSLISLLACVAGSASASTVYEYVYSGTYIDGSAAGHAFGESIGGLEYVPSTDDLYVAEGGSSASITRLSEAGAGVPFSGTGTASLSMNSGSSFGPNYTQVSVDQSGGPNDGNVYGSSGESYSSFTPDGQALPGLTGGQENACGIVPEPGGEAILINNREGLVQFSPTGEQVAEDYAGSPGLEANTDRKWSERGHICKPVFDSNNELYGIKAEGGELGGEGHVIKMSQHGLERYWVNPSSSSSAVAVDHSNNNVFVMLGDGTFEAFDSEGRLLGSGWGTPDPAHSYLGLAAGSEGITVDPATHDVWVTNRREYEGGVRHVEKFIPTNPHIIPDTTALPPEYPDPNGTSIVFKGTINPDGEATTGCYFEYGSTQALGSTVPCEQGNSFTGSTDQTVTSAPTSVTKGQRYWYKLVAKNANEQLAMSNEQAFLPQGKPIVDLALVDRVSTDGVRARAKFDPNGGNASFHMEYGPKGGPLNQSTPETHSVGFTTIERGVFEGSDSYEPGLYEQSQLITGLDADTAYEYRIAVSNEAGATDSETGEFMTYAPDAGSDSCPNVVARQQSGSSLLLDCRGYELASASNTGGYDVESDTVPGQAPLMAYPTTQGRLLYSLSDGVIPGIAGDPTNLGSDPYLAVRGPDGWTTEYVGLPANGMADEGAFGSPLLAADPSLNEFAFGGKGICSPCFADGSTNIPLRHSGGAVLEGMQGSLNPGSQANPAETVWQPFSADGSHLIFGSKAVFEPQGESSGSIYDRDLPTGVTQVVSTLPDGSTIAGGEVAELATSESGTRIVVGKKLSADSKGNAYYHLYMHIGTSPDSLDLTPGAKAGVLFDGMNEDGSRLFFTTTDRLLPADTDESADLYEDEVSPTGTVTMRLVSTKGGIPSNSDGCTPGGSPSWNAPSGNGKCGAVGFAGAAGVASRSGTLFFLSPEQLDGTAGTENEPNLYIVRPGGEPEFVATIDRGTITNPAIEHAVDENAKRTFGDIQVTADGKFAVFDSNQSLTGYPTLGHYQIYRFDSEGGAEPLACTSCAPTGAATAYDTFLTPTGLNLTEDGRVFFTTREALALRDTNELTDAYEWSHGTTQLISTGISPDNSSLVTVSADGRDAFFFTRETLVAGDDNGRAVKIYDAREGGGTVHDPALKPCAASDECHGPGTEPPGPPGINTVTGAGVEIRLRHCKRGFVKRRGSCIRRRHRGKHHRAGHPKNHVHHG